MDLNAARQRELNKYERAYNQQENYRMGARRMVDARRDLHNLPNRGAYLDVSCGCGEMLDHALAMGFKTANGTEIIGSLLDGNRIRFAFVHDLPFENNTFDVVTMFDVIEHLIPGDDEAACKEMQRVAKSHVLLTANNRPSFNKAGDDLHINKRPYDEWDALFRKWFDGKVTWLKGEREYVSEAWRIDL